MPTFVEAVQSVAPGDAPSLGRRIATRVETVGEAVGVLEDWTEASDDTRAELASKYETAKSLARDEIDEATDEDAVERGSSPRSQAHEDAAEQGSTSSRPGADDADALAPADLLTHPAVSDNTKRLLSEYSTKLHAFLDQERSYEEARAELRAAVSAELSLYERLLDDLGTDADVRDAQQAIARFAREETLGPPNATATEVILESAVEEDEEPG